MKKTLTLLIVISIIFTSIPMISGQNNDQNIKKSDASSDEETEYYAIIAACSNYEDEELNIPKFSPHGEWKLKKFYNNLIKAENWREENIILLINEEATVKNISNAFDQMANKIDENDVFLFSWQGHGSQVVDMSTLENPDFDEEDGYDEVIDPYNVYRDEEGVLHNYITDDELIDMFSNINSKGQFIIFDCCYSGGIANDLKDEKRVLVALTEEDDVGFIDLLIGFPMTMSLSLGLRDDFFKKGKDKNSDGYISAEELFNWSKPIINIATRGWIIESFIISLLIQKTVPRRGLFTRVKSFVSAVFWTFIVGYGVVQMITKKNSGSYGINSPHIIDMYDGDLNLIQI